MRKTIYQHGGCQSLLQQRVRENSQDTKGNIGIFPPLGQDCGLALWCDFGLAARALVVTPRLNQHIGDALEAEQMLAIQLRRLDEQILRRNEMSQ